jgi:transcriptional regulator with XRE-family HTH domain
VHPTYVSLLERGLRDPRLTSILKIAAALGIPAASLVRDAETASGS